MFIISKQAKVEIGVSELIMLVNGLDEVGLCGATVAWHAESYQTRNCESQREGKGQLNCNCSCYFNACHCLSPIGRCLFLVVRYCFRGVYCNKKFTRSNKFA